MDNFESYMVIPKATKTVSQDAIYSDNTADPGKFYVYKRQNIHGARVYITRPHAAKLWYPNLIVSHITGRSHSRCRTVDDVVYDTFYEAASKLELLDEIPILTYA